MKNREDDLFDREMKRKLKLENNKIPENINKKMDDTMANLGKKKLNYKKVSGICAACLAGTMLFGITMPTYAQNIPVIGKIFEQFNDIRYENFDNYASDLNVTKEDKGYSVTINKVVYDGFELNIFYTVQSDKPIKDDMALVDINLKVNDRKLNLGFGAMGEWVDENTYVGMRDYTVGEERMVPEKLIRQGFGEKVDIPNKFNLKIDINSIGELGTDGQVKGKWDFSIPVSSELVEGNVHEHNLDLNLQGKLEGTTITKVIQTPLNIIIQGVQFQEKSSTDDINFIIFDDKGRYILPKGGSASGFPYKENGCELYFTNNFKEAYSDSKRLTIIPYISNNHKLFEDSKEESGSDKAETVKTIENEKVKVNISKDGKNEVLLENGEVYSKITKIESDGKTSKVYYESPYSIYGKPVNFINNKTGDIIKPLGNENEDYSDNIRHIKGDEFVISFNGDLTKDDYSAEFSVETLYERVGEPIIVDLK